MSVVVTSRKKKGDGKDKWLPLVWILCAVVVISVGLWFWLGGDASSVTNDNDAGMRRPPVNEVQQNPTQDASPPKMHTPQVVKDNSELQVQNSELPSKPKPPKPKTDPKFPQYFDEDGNFIKGAGRMMLPDGRVLTFPPPVEGKPRTVVSGSRLYECDHEGNFKDVTPRKLFDTDFENQFQGLAVANGAFIGVFLKGLDQDAVIELLRKPVTYIGDETEKEKEIKAAVAEMKQVALQYIEAGGTFDDFVTEIEAMDAAEKKVRSTALRQVITLYKEGNVEEARKRAEAFDAAMSEQGFSPLRLPKHVENALFE